VALFQMAKRRRSQEEHCLQLQDRAVEKKWLFILKIWNYLLALLNANYLFPDPIKIV